MSVPKLDSVVFAYDGGFKCSNNIFYSGGGFPSSNWLRYLAFTKKLVVAARIEYTNTAPLGGVVSSRDEVDFVQVPNISGPIRLITNQRAAQKVLSKVISQADLVIVRLPSEIGLLAIHVCKRINKPYAIELVGDVKEAMSGHGSLMGRLYSPIVFKRTRSAVSSAQACIYVTERYLQAIYPCKGVTGYASNVNLRLESESEIKRNIKVRSSQRTLTFGLIGSVKSDYKGIDVGIRALKLLKEMGVYANIRVLGDGDPSRYQRMASEFSVSNLIHFDGVLSSSDDVYRWLDNLTYYIQPSKTEGLPRALIEAMSRGLPALGSDRGGIPELLRNDCIFHFSDPSALAAKIVAFSNMSDEAYIRLGLYNYQRSTDYDGALLEAKREEFWGSVLIGVPSAG